MQHSHLLHEAFPSSLQEDCVILSLCSFRAGLTCLLPFLLNFHGSICSQWGWEKGLCLRVCHNLPGLSKQITTNWWLNRNQIFSHGSRGPKAEIQVSTGSVPSRGSVNAWTGWMREWSTWKFSLWIKTQCLLPTFPFLHPCPCPTSPPGTSRVYRASVRREGSCMSVFPAPTSSSPHQLFFYVVIIVQ